MPQDTKVSIEDLLKRIGYMAVQLDVASDTIFELRAEIDRLKAELDKQPQVKKQK